MLRLRSLWTRWKLWEVRLPTQARKCKPRCLNKPADLSHMKETSRSRAIRAPARVSHSACCFCHSAQQPSAWLPPPRSWASVHSRQREEGELSFTSPWRTGPVAPPDLGAGWGVWTLFWLAVGLLKLGFRPKEEGENGYWGGSQESRPQHVNKLEDTRRRTGQGARGGASPGDTRRTGGLTAERAGRGCTRAPRG